MMSIVSYSEIALRLQAKIDDDTSISAKNKKILAQFMQSYDVSDARKGIFLSKVHPFIQRFTDITQVSRDEVNTWFSELKAKYAPATLATHSNVTCRLMRWVNDGILPKAFNDMSRYRGKKIRRNLQPEDMVSWEDGIEMAKFATSPQLMAVITTQLDGGLRPSEFISLNYGDVSIVDNLFVCLIRSGKTGARHVVLIRATPYLKQWMDSHPTRHPSDPLWIDETQYRQKSVVVRYQYPALARRVKKLGTRAKITKPLDFYNLRHSSCSLDKKDNIPAELAAERHGHSIKYYMDVYGRLDVKDTVGRFKTHFGMEAGIQTNPMQRYAVQPNVIKPTATETEAFVQQQTVQQQIQMLQQQLSMMQQQPAPRPAPGISPIPAPTPQQIYPTYSEQNV